MKNYWELSFQEEVTNLSDLLNLPIYCLQWVLMNGLKAILTFITGRVLRKYLIYNQKGRKQRRIRLGKYET